MEGAGPTTAPSIKVMQQPRNRFGPSALHRNRSCRVRKSATVVGPSGDEIYTDEFSRVKVQFHWDRYGKHDETACAAFVIPMAWLQSVGDRFRSPCIGQASKIVDFPEGDPDEPIITVTYNAESDATYILPTAPEYERPAKSRSSLGGGTAKLQRDSVRGQERFQQPSTSDERRTRTSKLRTTRHTGWDMIARRRSITMKRRL